MGFTKKTWLALALAIVLVLGLSVSASAAVTGVDISGAGTQALTTGSGTTSVTRTVTLTNFAAGDIPTTAKVASSATNVATVSPAAIANGGTITITAVAPGTADITVTYGTYSATVAVTVTPSGITLSNTADVVLKTQQIGNGQLLFTVTDTANNALPTVSGSTLTADKVIAVSSASAVAEVVQNTSVSNGFVVTPLTPGEATITVSYGTTAAYDKTFKVTVMPAAMQTDFTTSLSDPFYSDTVGLITTVGTGVFQIQGSTYQAGWKALEAGTVLTVAATPANIVTVTPDAISPTSFTIAPASATAAGKVKLVATYKVGTETVTCDVAEFTVLDPLKVQSFAVKMDNGAAFAADKDKDAKTVDYIDGDNVHLFEVSDILPLSAKAKDNLDDGIVGQNIKWSTSTSKVVKITTPALDATGKVKEGETLSAYQANIKFLKTGTGKLTVEVDGVKRTFTFTVKTKKATAIVTIPDMNLIKDQYKQVKPVAYVGTVGAADYNPNVRTNFTYSSSKKTVATVSSKGVVKGVKAGTAKITAKDKISGKKTSFTVTVGTDISKIGYRAYALVSQTGSYEDAGLMEALMAVNYNGKDPALKWAKTHSTAGVDLAQIKSELTANVLTGQNAATEDDVFVFFFSGKINTAGEIELKNDENNKPTTIKVDALLSELANIPGTVFLIMDCDMSSLALTTKGAADLTPAQFNNMVINTAKRKSLQAKTIGTASADVGSYKQKFKVLVSTSTKKQTANYDTYQYTDGGNPYTMTSRWFTQHLVTGFGSDYASTRMPADANKNRVITLKELYNYVSKNVKADVATYNKGKAKADKVSQVVSVYPAKGDAFPVYARISPTFPW